MTIRELRQMLFSIDNQDLTVRDLRAILFGIDDQDKEITESQIMQLTKEVRSDG